MLLVTNETSWLEERENNIVEQLYNPPSETSNTWIVKFDWYIYLEKFAKTIRSSLLL